MKLSRKKLGLAIGLAMILSLVTGLWVAKLISLSWSHSEMASYHAEEVAKERRNLESLESPKPLSVSGIGELEAGSTLRVRWEKASRLRVAYHADLKEKYERASGRPWLAVEADPADPGSEWMMPPSLPHLTDDVHYLERPTPPKLDPAVQPAVNPVP